MINASCHCGAVRLAVETPPSEITECNCSICRRTGARMAYYSPKQVHFTPATPATDVYMWGDKMLEFHRCKTCGCFTHWRAVDKTYDRMGVNTRMMEPEALAGARLRPFDGADTWKFLDE